VVDRVGTEPIQARPPRAREDNHEDKQAPPLTVFTNDPNNWLENSFYSELFQEHPGLKLQRELSTAAHVVIRGQLLLDLADMDNFKELEPSDLVAEMSPGKMNKMLQLDFSQRYSIMTKIDFICFFRFFLRLPQLLTLPGTEEHKASGDTRARCMSCANGLLDPFGNHAAGACPSASAANHARHAGFQQELLQMSRLADMEAHREPPTATLLNQEVSPAAARTLFPKTVTQAQQQLIDEFKQHLDHPPDQADQKAYKHWKAQGDVLQQRATTGREQVGRRVDIHVVSDRPEGQQERVVDTSITHPTNKSNLSKSTKHAQLSLRKLLNRLGKNEKPSNTSPALTQRINDKVKTYATLMLILEKQFRENRRLSLPEFVPAIATTHGELGPELHQFLEWIIMGYKAKMKQMPPRPDGQNVADLARTFRRRLRERVLVAIMKGTARVLRTAGLSKWACRKHA
jgi:hypothetical protein